MAETESRDGASPSRLIDGRIRELGDWRGETLARVRELITKADPAVVEEWKWRGVPVWEHDGIICTGETYKAAVKLTFAKGASLPDPKGLFNASLEGTTRRAIDLHEGDKLNATAFKALVRAAVALNTSKTKAPSKRTKSTTKAPATSKRGEPVLLSGGNPQIPMGYGDEPVQAYIAAMPGWKSDLGAQLDALIVKAVPGVCKAVKWNSPLYGVEEGEWFLSLHCYTKYVKVTFFSGSSLRPAPLGTSKYPEVRHLDIHEDDFDAVQFAKWVKQASKLPGERL